MKILHIACLACALWLTGCATTGPSQDSAADSAPSTPTGAPPRTAHTPVIPNGPLRPITAAQASSGEVASPSAPADLWDRIRRGFAMPDLQHELVQDREQWYATRPDHVCIFTSITDVLRYLARRAPCTRNEYEKCDE